MRPKTIGLFVTAFVTVHFVAGLFCFWADISSANYVMAHYYQEAHGYPKDWMCLASDMLWFPLGPFSSLVWAIPVYGLLKVTAWLANAGSYT